MVAKITDAQWGLVATVLVAFAGLLATALTTWWTLRNQRQMADADRVERLRTERRKLLVDLLDKLSEITTTGGNRQELQGYTWLTSRVRQLAMSVGDPELDEIAAETVGRGDFIPGSELYARMERRATHLLREALGA